MNNLYLYSFYFFAGLAIASAIFIALTKKIIYAAFGLMVTFLSVAAIYVFAGADFIAITQIMVYVGGVLILIIFGVMLTNRLSGSALITTSRNKIIGFACGGAMFTLMMYCILSLNFSQMKSSFEPSESPSQSTVHKIGYGLVTDNILIFEITGILLLIALLGAVILAGNKVSPFKHVENDSN